MKTQYFLRADDGRVVTSDIVKGAYLTKSLANSYLWDSKEFIERERKVYELIFGMPLAIEVFSGTGLRF